MTFLRRRRFLFAFGLAAILRAQQPWTAAESPSTEVLWGVTHGNNLFVAVGEAGAILSSPDGVTWTSRFSGTEQWLLAADWAAGPRLYVVVGDAGTILTSPDGMAWTRRESGTTQRLNSVKWGADSLLVVGESGTALTSPDGVAWTTRITGDSGWLRGLAFGNGTFVVTGHDGTILTTTNNGTTFQSRTSGTTLHLDAVAFHDGKFHVTGTAFVFASSGDNGATWTRDPRANADGRENVVTYNALVSFNRALVIAGDLGRIIDERGRLWGVTEPLDTDWRAVAASGAMVVAVGTHGGIAFAPLDTAVPHATEIATVGTTYLGDSPTLRATAVRAPPLAYQWSFNGQPVAGATAASLELRSLTQAQAGVYRVAITFGDGSSTAETSLTPRPNPPTVDLVDTTFRPVLINPPGAIIPLPDGNVYVAGQQVAFSINGRLVEGPVRLRTDGTIDPTFGVTAGSLPGGYIQGVVLQPDGRLVLLIRRYNFPPVEYRLARLNVDGSIDASFRPDAALSGTGNTPTLLADGRWLAFASDKDAAKNRVVNVRRFRSDGTVDPTFTTHTFSAPGPATANNRPLPTKYRQVLTTRDSAGRVYVSAADDGNYAPGLFGDLTGFSLVFRLNADGTRDPTFETRTFRELALLAATDRGIVAQSVFRGIQRPQLMHQRITLFRLKFDGTTDITFQPIEDVLTPEASSSIHANFNLTKPVALADGSVVAHALNWVSHSGLLRFDPAGNLDRDFSADIDAPSVTQLSIPPVRLANGQFLVGGSFTELNGVPQPYLARLNPNSHATTTTLTNLSVRAQVSSEPLIVGFVTSNGVKSVLARGIGPALLTFGVTGVLADPEIAFYSGTTSLQSNDDWDTALAPTAAALGAFPLTAGSRDAATLLTLSAGGYSTLVSGKNGATGVALAEIYDNDPRPVDARSPRLINLSVRTFAGTGSDTLTAGFTISGNNTRTLLIRGVGQNLAAFGVTNTLADPVLTIFRGTTALASNDDWATTEANRERMLRTFRTVGAFALINRVAKQDAALAIALTPGSYTVQLTGFNGATGQALLEIYEVP